MIEPRIPKSLTEVMARSGLQSALLGRAEAEHLPPDSGAYLLILGLENPVRIARGRREPKIFAAGWYIYAGNAHGPGGIKARVGRHFRRGKPRHWHIDGLTEQAVPYAAGFPGRTECDLVAALGADPRLVVPAPGFGSSDCRTCESHLLAWLPASYQPGRMP